MSFKFYSVQMTKKNKIFLKLVHKRDKVMSVSNIFRFKKQEMDHFSERKVSEYFCRFFCVYNIGFLNTTKNINSNFFKTQAGWFFVGVHLLIQEMIHSLRMCLSSHVGHYDYNEYTKEICKYSSYESYISTIKSIKFSVLMVEFSKTIPYI